MLNAQVSTIDGCMLRCALCPRCNFVTVSLGAPRWACAWFSSCDMTAMTPIPTDRGRGGGEAESARALLGSDGEDVAALAASFEGEQLTMPLVPADRQRLLAAHERSLESQLMAHAAAGFCGITNDADPGNCSAQVSVSAQLGNAGLS